jgi:Protein of unknown function (DUF4232)
MKVSALVGPVLIAAVLATACGCSASGSTSASTSPASAAGTAATATSGLAAQAAGPQHCPSSALQVRTAPGSGEAMDGVYWDLTFTNMGKATCALYGYPGVSFLAASRTAITAPASRASASPHQVTLAPGQTASAQVKTPNVGNLPKDVCHQATAPSVQVYPPNDTVPVIVHTGIGVCAGHSPGGSVWPVVPGNHAGV